MGREESERERSGKGENQITAVDLYASGHTGTDEQECSKSTDLLVQPKNPNANSCCSRVPRVPTKTKLGPAPVVFELSCKQ